MPRVIHISDQVSLVDISADLPKHPTRRYGQRDPALIDRLFVHHTGGSTRPSGRRAVERTAKFFVSPDDPDRAGLQGRGWPGFGYTYFVPFTPDRTDGRMEIYRCQPDEALTWHTGSKPHPGNENRVGIGVAFQGRFRSEYDDISVLRPSNEQLECADALWPWLQKRHGILPTGLFTHSMYGKPACPGQDLERWVLEQRRQRLRPHTTWAQRQQFLAELGFAPGSVDGIPGLRTKHAIIRFQRAHGVRADGEWSPQTEHAVALLLREVA